MKDTYTGIDYGNGKANIDEKTGIRFGVISARVVDYWYECSELFYSPCEEPSCVESGNCDCEIEPDWCGVDTEKLGASADAGQYASSDDIFVTRSEYYTRAQFCSPCAPGACHLENPIPNGEKAFCLGPEWFSGSAPYPIYRVSDDSIVSE